MATYDLSHIPELRDLQDLANRQKARDEALKARVKALENKGGQANVIETIKVNGQAQAVNAKAVDITVPTKTSQLTNDSSWQTSAQVASAIQTAIAKTGHASFQKVDTVPGMDSATENVMYLVLNPKTKHYDIYAKIKGTNGSYTMEQLDDTTVDLSGYVQKENGKRLMTDAEGEKLKGISAGATKTAASETNGHITIDGVDTTVYTEPSDVIHGTVASDSDVTAMLTEVFGA